MNQNLPLAPQLTDVDLCHPDWLEICEKIREVFGETSNTYKWALDAVIAHQLGKEPRSRRSLRMIGDDAANRLRTICKPYQIELSDLKLAA